MHIYLFEESIVIVSMNMSGKKYLLPTVVLCGRQGVWGALWIHKGRVINE